jgi:hypothetical protein
MSPDWHQKCYLAIQDLPQLVERWMRSFLINKNLCLYYWLKKRIGKKLAFCIAITLEKALLIFGREKIPYFEKNES